MKINGNLVFNTDASGEIQNAYLERLASAPSFNGAQAGRVYYNTSDGLYYYNDGASWVPFATGGNAAALQTEVDNIEATLGAGIQGNGTIGTFDAVVTDIVGSTPTTWTQVINALALEAQSTDTLAELDDVSLGALSAGHVLYYSGTDWVNAAPGATSGVQAHDIGLDSLSSMTGPGFVSVSADGNTFLARTFQMPAEGIAMTNTSGGGNPTISLTNDLAAVEGLTTNGIAVRTAADTWATRSVVGGSTGTIIVANGDGTAGDPTLDLQTLTIPTDSGTFYKFSYDTHGRVTAVQAVAQADITGLVDSVYVNVSGDTMAGALNMGGNKITSLGTPTDGTDAATKAYVDATAEGLSVKPAVLAATTGNLTATYDNGTAGVGATLNLGPSASLTIDGFTFTSTFQGVLVKDQTNAFENGRYYVSQVGGIGTDWILTRCSYCDEAEEIPSMFVFVQEGTLNKATGWAALVENPATFTVGTDDVNFTQFSGAGTYSAGNGLDLNGTEFSVLAGAGLSFLPGSEVGVEIHNYTGSALGFHDGVGRVATTGVATAGDTLALFLDGSTLAQSGTGLKVAAGGITEVEINSSALDANAGITGGSGAKLALNVNTTHLEVAGNVLSIKDNGVTTVKILDGNVTNAKLQNSTISLTDGSTTDAVALGETVTLSGTNGIAVTVAANAVDVELTAGLDELADVSVGVLNPNEGGASGSVLMYQGSPDIWAPQRIYYRYDAGAPATSHAITHNIGQQYCNVTVVDNNDEVVIPQSITFNNANQLTVTFTSALQCTVVIMGVPLNPQVA